MTASAMDTGTGDAHSAGQVEMILSQIESLPTLPAVAMKLVEMTTDGRSGAAEITQVIKADQSLSARVLSAVRRSDIGARVESIDRAVVLLGFEAIRNLVLSVQVVEYFSNVTRSLPADFEWAGFWRHCLAVGCAAKLLAECDTQRQHDEASLASNGEKTFAGGLLHDIGKLALLHCFPKSYERVLEKTGDWQTEITAAEREVFGMDHTLAGKRLAGRWKLPALIGECAWLHHHTPETTPSRIGCQREVQLVQLADRLVRKMRIGYSGNPAAVESLLETAKAAGFTADDVGQVEAALPELIEARAELVGLDRLTSKEVYAGALADANAELSRLNTKLGDANRRLARRSRYFEAMQLLESEEDGQRGHEEVSRQAARAIQLVTGVNGVAVVFHSVCRGPLCGAAIIGSGEDGRCKVLSAELFEALKTIETGTAAWLPASLLPGSLIDELKGNSGETVQYWSPLYRQGQLIGAVAVDAEWPPEMDASLTALLKAIETRLDGAEKQAVDQQLNEELAEMNRRLADSRAEIARMRSLAMIGDMAAGAAHELNNPLAVISGRAQILNREELGEEVVRGAKLISEHAHKASTIVEELMEFAKPSPPQPTDISLGEFLSDIRQNWLEKSKLTEKQFHLRLSDNLPRIRADAAQMGMLFDAVICNAVEAMQNTSDPELVINCRGNLTDERIMIEIKDNGSGMSTEVLEQAMVPFYSYRPAGRGRGLGLSRAMRYAQINGGRIHLSSASDEGTTVFVELPITGE